MSTPARPPKKNMMEVIKLIDAKMEQCAESAVRAQAMADNPPNERTDPAYWQKRALAEMRKKHRLEVVAQWMEELL